MFTVEEKQLRCRKTVAARMNKWKIQSVSLGKACAQRRTAKCMTMTKLLDLAGNTGMVDVI